MQITMPKLGLTMTQGTITEWLKQPGDAVPAEEPLCVYETEKVTLELVAPADGVLVTILAPVGTAVPVGDPVCEFGPTAPSDGGFREKDRIATGQTQPHAALNATPKARVLARMLGVDLAGLRGSGPEGRVQACDVEAIRGERPGAPKATPLARRMAGAEGIDLSGLAGTGPDGTVTREDVEAAIVGRHAGTASGLESGAGRLAGAAPPGAGGSTQGGAGLGQSGGTAAIAGRAGLRSEVIPHSALRRTIAERMSQSAFTAPHVTLMTEAEATNLVSARNQLNEELPAPAKFGYNAVLAALTARALREHPHLNARWEADGIHVLTDINIALAVDTERGLMTPVLRNVDRLGLSEIQRGFAGLAERALAGRAMPDDFEGGTFTLTNLGAAEVDGFTPIINPPQAAILGVGRIVEKPVARDGVVVIRPMVVLSLSFDHRIVDGGPAARFLQRMKQLVERPMVLLLG